MRTVITETRQGRTATCSDCGRLLDFHNRAESCTEFTHKGVTWIITPRQ